MQRRLLLVRNFEHELMKNRVLSDAIRSFGEEELDELKETKAGIVVLNTVCILGTAQTATLIVLIGVDLLAVHVPLQRTRTTQTIKPAQ